MGLQGGKGGEPAGGGEVSLQGGREGSLLSVSVHAWRCFTRLGQAIRPHCQPPTSWVQALEDACIAARQRRVEVVICTYDKLRLHVDLLSAVPWKAAIFDEVGPGGSSPGGRYTVLGSLDGPWRATT